MLCGLSRRDTALTPSLAPSASQALPYRPAGASRHFIFVRPPSSAQGSSANFFDGRTAAEPATACTGGNASNLDDIPRAVSATSTLPLCGIIQVAGASGIRLRENARPMELDQRAGRPLSLGNLHSVVTGQSSCTLRLRASRHVQQRHKSNTPSTSSPDIGAGSAGGDPVPRERLRTDMGLHVADIGSMIAREFRCSWIKSKLHASISMMEFLSRRMTVEKLTKVLSGEDKVENAYLYSFRDSHG